MEGYNELLMLPQIIGKLQLINLRTTMRLDPSYLHFISKEELRILVAIEIGMKNHQYVPVQLISMIGHLRSGETFRTLKKLLKNKLVVHVGKKYDGYKLTYLGYDYLALHTFLKRGVLKDVICKIGVGKESDIYKCETPDGTHVVLKLTRLGRRSFKTIKNNREYLQGRNNYNWLYLSRLSSIREFTFMQVLHEDGFPTPKPIDTNRHAIVMSLIDGDPLCHIKKVGEHCSVKQIFQDSLVLVKKFASRGLIHGDFNEFNILINAEGQLTVIDFPQCISSRHMNAQDYFNRDVECLYTFFDKMLKKSHRLDDNDQVFMHAKDEGFDVSQIPMPVLEEVVVEKRLDQEVMAKGHFKLSEDKQLEDFMKLWNEMRNQERKLGMVEEQEEDESDKDQGQDESDQSDSEKIEELEKKLEIQEEPISQELRKMSHEADEDLGELMAELKGLKEEGQPKQAQKVAGQQPEAEDSESSEEQGDEESEAGFVMREQWKGMTAYEIRQKLKEERRLERQKKKEEMSTDEYIKKALHKKKKPQRDVIPRGNYGAKKKAQSHAQKIKDGMQMGW